MAPQQSPQTYSLDTIARLLDIDPSYVRKLVKAGVLPESEKSRYDLVSSVHGYIRYLRDLAKNKPSSDARQRWLNAKAEVAEMEAAKVKGELLSAEEVTAGWHAAIGRSRALLLGVPTASAERLVMAVREADDDQKASRAVRDILKAFITHALNELANTTLEDVEGDDGAAVVQSLELPN